MDGNYRVFGFGYGLVCCFGNQRPLTEARFQKWLIKAELACFFERIWPNTAGYPVAVDFAVGIFFSIFELEQVLRHDDVAFHADDFGNLGGAA